MPSPIEVQSTEPGDDGGVAVVGPDSPAGPPATRSRKRKAFRRRDVTASRLEHDKPHGTQDDKDASDYVKAIVFGGLDGIITTFAIVAAAAGGGQDNTAVLIFGFANVFADAWSMGFGEFIAATAEIDHARAERQREEWEVENYIEGEKKEMIAIYMRRGISAEDARTMVDIISKDKKIFVDIMMIEELEITCDYVDNTEPAKQGLVMFVSFVCFGMFPLLAYLSGKGKGIDEIFGVACAISGVALLLLGSVKGYLTSQNIPSTAMLMLFNGLVSGGVSFGLGILVEYVINGRTSL
jgi:vacuolar iron transporter family protein